MRKETSTSCPPTTSDSDEIFVWLSGGGEPTSVKSDIPVPLLLTVPGLHLSSYGFSKNILVGLF